MFLDGERVDMTVLAAQLDVNRVTVYRWVGSRDQLLVEVLWSLATGVLARAEDRATGTGRERLVRTLVAFVEEVIASSAMQRWIEDEGDLALRLLTRHDTGFQPRLRAAVEHLLVQAQDAEPLELPIDLREASYVILRVIESYIYLDLIAGEDPDAARAEPVFRLLVRG